MSHENNNNMGTWNSHHQKLPDEISIIARYTCLTQETAPSGHKAAWPPIQIIYKK